MDLLPAQPSAKLPGMEPPTVADQRLILIVWSGALLTWAIAGFTEVTVSTGLALGWLGFGIGVWVALTKLR